MNSVTINEEKKYWLKGFKYIAGIDEAGRGPLAGPVVCSSVMFRRNIGQIKDIDDSKKLNKKQREYLFNIICEKAFSISICIVDETIIDKINIFQATVFGMKNCIEQLDPMPEVVLVDGMKLPVSDNIIMKKIIKGDSKVMSIASASIIAKVTRDNIMHFYHKRYPDYGFDKNSGYPTRLHKEAINKYGILGIHRRTFKPVKILLK